VGLRERVGDGKKGVKENKDEKERARKGEKRGGSGGVGVENESLSLIENDPCAV
jgi:hypothetical protein